MKYTPNQIGDSKDGKPKQRIIKVHTMQKDPLAPASFKHKKIMRGPGSPPVPILHSPKRKVTVQDQKDWKIPPCISNWKNARGYTIPLEMRLAADGRSLEQHTISDKFAKQAEALYIADRQARENIRLRNEIKDKIAYNEFEKEEKRLKTEADKAIREKKRILEEGNLGEGSPGLLGKRKAEDISKDEEKEQRDMLRHAMRNERIRNQRLEFAGKNKAKEVRKRERDITEKIALGQAQPTKSDQVMFDQRLYN